MQWSAASFCSSFQILSPPCDHCLNSSVPAESWPFTSHVGVRFSRLPDTHLFGLHAHLTFANLLNAPAEIQRWALPSAVPFSRRACPHQLCRWKFHWEIIPQPRSGSTIFFAPCLRRCGNSIFLLRA